VDIHNLFLANEKEIFIYKNKDLINKRLAFTDINGDAWSFALAIGYTFKIWEEREGGFLMIDWDDTNLSLSTSDTNEILLNAPATDTNIERGKYYYEIEYLIDGGYTILIAYGTANII